MFFSLSWRTKLDIIQTYSDIFIFIYGLFAKNKRQAQTEKHFRRDPL